MDPCLLPAPPIETLVDDWLPPLFDWVIVEVFPVPDWMESAKLPVPVCVMVDELLLPPWKMPAKFPGPEEPGLNVAVLPLFGVECPKVNAAAGPANPNAVAARVALANSTVVIFIRSFPLMYFKA